MPDFSANRETGESAAAAATGVPGVARLSAGRFGEVALLLPGARVPGIRAAERDGVCGLEVHLVFDVDSGRTIDDVVRAVREAVIDAAGAPFVDIVVADAERPSPRPVSP